MRKFAVITCMFAAGCVNADLAQYGALGSSGHVTCYSGGKIIYDGDSDGKIMSENGSDGWYFMEKSTGRLVRVSGDCLIKN